MMTIETINKQWTKLISDKIRMLQFLLVKVHHESIFRDQLYLIFLQWNWNSFFRCVGFPRESVTSRGAWLECNLGKWVTIDNGKMFFHAKLQRARSLCCP